MKLTIVAETANEHIVKWYDPAYGWVVSRRDKATGYEIEADYVGHKSALPSAIAFALSKGR